MTNLIGWIGGILLAFCALPQALQSIEQGHSEGVNGTFLLMWFVGELCLLYYTLEKTNMTLIPILVNYIFNLTFIIIIGYYLL